MNQETKKERQELKYFLIFLGVLVIGVLMFGKITSHAEEAEEYIAVINTKEGNKIYDPAIGTYTYVIGERPTDIDSAGNNVDSETGDVLASAPNESHEGTEGNTVTEVYIPDSDDDCPVSEQVPISVELQEYLWTRCKKACPDAYKDYYAFCLGVMQHESTFRPKATHKNGNGSIDRGIMQINSSNVKKMKNAGLISSSDDLFDPEKCIDCGLHMLNNYVSKFGISESAYYAYNTGREREGSNKNSRIVWGYYQNWKEILFS